MSAGRVTGVAVLVLVCCSLVARAAEKPPRLPLPPIEVRHQDGEFGREQWAWEGVSVVDDPDTDAKYFFGGRIGGVQFGSIGNWSLAADGKTWTEIKSPSAVLDPLRKKTLAVRVLVKEGEAAARNLFYDTPKHFAAEIADSAGKLLTEGRDDLVALRDSLAAAKADGWRQQGIDQALELVTPWAANSGLRRPQCLYSAGVGQSARNLDICFQTQWALDEAADCLASEPGPREQATAAYDPENKCIVLFGGNHGDYALGDTWIFDCAEKSWRRAWPKSAPGPRFAATMKWNEEKHALALSGGNTILNKMVYQQGEMPAPAGEWFFDAKTGEWSGTEEPVARIYRTIVPKYDPRVYDAPLAESKERSEIAKTTSDWLGNLPSNTWTVVPKRPVDTAEREWGTAVFDPDRDQIYRWSGGHQADPSTLVSTYHPALNCWSIPFVPEIFATSLRKGMSFNGRPDCANHTYLHYAYDPVSRRLVCIAMGGTCVYNPDRRDFDYNVAQPFNRQIYETCTVGTPRGVIAWVRDYFGVFDVAKKEWTKLPKSGDKLPNPVCDGSAVCYDSQRDALWLTTFINYQKPSGNIWRYDLKTGEVKSMNPANADSIARAKGFNSEIRESTYLPTADLVLYNNFVGGAEVAYDPVKNRWATLNISKGSGKDLERLGTVSDTLVYDAKRGLVWNVNAYQFLYVLKVDAKGLVLSDGPGK